jgi:RES domain-containing protein
MKKIPGAPLQGFFFRSIPLKHAGSPLDALSSKSRGGRYNPAGAFQVYYLADRVDATLYETRAIAAGAVPHRIFPSVTFTVDVELQHVVDLTIDAVRNAIGVVEADLLVEWQDLVARGIVPITQDVGSAARAADIEALKVPSARLPGATNLAIIVDNLRVGSVLRINPVEGFTSGTTVEVVGKR